MLFISNIYISSFPYFKKKCMKINLKVILLVIFFLPIIFLMLSLFMPIEILADVTNTTVIQVNISEVSSIEVSPTNIAWNQVAPGTNSSVTQVSVLNTGSSSFAAGIFISVDSFANITNNPTAGDSASKYMAGSFLVVANSTTLTNDLYYFVNQISWNESTYPSPTNPTAGAISWGFYNNKTNSWLWELKPSADGTCRNMTDTALKIKTTVDSGAGSRDLSTNTASGTASANTTDWATWTFSSGPFLDYCVASSTDCKRLMIYVYDKNSSLPSCTKATWIAPGTFSPGVTKYFQLKVHIPSGVPAGTVTNSTVTFTADSA